MPIPQFATAVTTRSIEHLVAATPAGHVPMFEIVEASEDYILGDPVYLKDGKLYDCITDNKVDEKLVSGLHFKRYIQHP